MASNSRRQIERWLRNIEVSGSVIDVGGLFFPIKGRTKTWEATDYKIVDVKSSRNGINADYVADFNFPVNYPNQHDTAFLIEVTDHFWNPVQAFKNINSMLKKDGLLYISSNFIFPHHTGFDCIRFTCEGLAKVLFSTGFDILSLTARKAVDSSLEEALRKESKVMYHAGDIGYMIKARKNGL